MPQNLIINAFTVYQGLVCGHFESPKKNKTAFSIVVEGIIAMIDNSAVQIGMLIATNPFTTRNAFQSEASSPHGNRWGRVPKWTGLNRILVVSWGVPANRQTRPKTFLSNKLMQQWKKPLIASNDVRVFVGSWWILCFKWRFISGAPVRLITLRLEA